MKRLFELGTVFDDPALDGGVVHLTPRSSIVLPHADAQGYAIYHRMPVRIISCGKWAPLKLIAMVALPLRVP